LFYVSFAGLALGLGLGTVSLDYKTGKVYRLPFDLQRTRRLPRRTEDIPRIFELCRPLSRLSY